MKKIIISIMFLSVSIIFGKAFQVTSFAKDPTDRIAQYRPIEDINGNKCAVLKVKTEIKNIQFNSSKIRQADEYSRPEKYYRIYVQEGTQSISFSKNGYTTLDYRLPINVRSGVTYRLEVAELENNIDAPKLLFENDRVIFYKLPWDLREANSENISKVIAENTINSLASEFVGSMLKITINKLSSVIGGLLTGIILEAGIVGWETTVDLSIIGGNEHKAGTGLNVVILIDTGDTDLKELDLIIEKKIGFLKWEHVSAYKLLTWQENLDYHISIGKFLIITKPSLLTPSIPGKYRLKVMDRKTVITVIENTQFKDGKISGIVKDAFNGSSLDRVNISIKKSDEVIKTINNSSDGSFEIGLPKHDNYSVTFQKNGYQMVEYNNISVEDRITTNLEPVMQIEEKYSGNGIISGFLFNSINNKPVSRVKINIRSGINTLAGSILYSTFTDNKGYYFIQAISGNYTLEASKEGFSNSKFSVISLGGKTTSNQNGTISPILDSGQIRIVLTWGASPRDLDSHLYGPVSGSSGRFHISYNKKKYTYYDKLIAELDIDDRKSYGPETTTIYKKSGELYKYIVHDYTNKKANNSIALSNSAAQVRVYKGSDLLKTFFVPTGKRGNAWTVFKMDGNTITSINELNYKKLSK